MGPQPCGREGCRGAVSPGRIPHLWPMMGSQQGEVRVPRREKQHAPISAGQIKLPCSLQQGCPTLRCLMQTSGLRSEVRLSSMTRRRTCFRDELTQC